jgi:transposase
MMLSAGQMNDQKGANILASLLPPARELIADRGYDSNPFRTALAERGIAACIPPKKNRKVAIPYDKALYRQRHRIEIAFGRLKDWRRIATRYGMVHSFSVLFKTRYSSLSAASSVGKWPRARTALRSLAFSASMAFVV